MPFILQDGELVEVTDEQFAAYNSANPVGVAVPAGGQVIQVTDTNNAANNQQIINPNTTDTAPAQTLPTVAAPVSNDDPTTSPYGEQNETFDPTLVAPDPALFTEEYVQNQDNPVEEPVAQGNGVSPYGEEDAPVDPDLVTQPAAVTEDPAAAEAALEAQFEQQRQTELSADAARQQALLNQLRQQATFQAQRKQANEGDWRVRLTLAESADYLYRDPGLNEDGVLWPLAITNGVVFPYTPQISTNYVANYTPYDLTHSNYRGYFYQGSHVGEISLVATFTAQDTNEASYLLAVIHFFRSVTKMFYGKDAQRGAPPPLVFLRGLGEFQFNLHPCVISNFNYVLPDDVDYIRTRSISLANPTNLLQRRQRQDLPTNAFSSAIQRLSNAGLKPGAINNAPPPVTTFGTNRPTYVPTKMQITLTLLPVQTRQQVSQQFSVKEFANGNLLKGGFW